MTVILWDGSSSDYGHLQCQHFHGKIENLGSINQTNRVPYQAKLRTGKSKNEALKHVEYNPCVNTLA